MSASKGQFLAHEFQCLDTASFNPRDYSRLKFGSDLVAKEFGYAMADGFYAAHRLMLITDRCVVVPSAFNTVPIAASILAEHFYNRLNDLLSRQGHRTVEMTTMHRTMSYVADYSFLPRAQREALLSADKLFINKDFIEGKVLLFVDDVTITGTHERKIEAFLAEQGLINPHIFCYYAKYNGERADIEAALNLSGISTPEAYLELIKEPNHHVVVRAVRFLLDNTEEDLMAIVTQLDVDFLDRLYHACLSKGYNLQDTYRDKFKLVRARRDALIGAREASVERLRA